MVDQIAQLFSSQGFMPHGMCFAWTPSLLWTMVGADFLIAASYYSIPAALFVVVRRRRQQSLNWILLMFAAFIMACGTTHLIDIWTIWYPKYWLDAFAKVGTAGVSAATAVALWPIVSRATSYVEEKERTAHELTLKNEELADTLRELERQRSDLHVLNEFSGMVSAANTEGEMGAMVADVAARLWPGRAGAFYLRAPDSADFERVEEWGDASNPREIDGESCWACRLARPFPGAERVARVECGAAECGTGRSCLPVLGGGRVHGLLQLEREEGGEEDARSTALLSILIERVGLALHELRLKRELEVRSTRDALTGLFNRRYMEETLTVEERRVERYGSTFSVALFDLDHFKRLNDTHGHEAGDAALRLFAEVVREDTRAADVPCRYGGEEFLVVLPDTDTDRAARFAERVRANLELTCERHGDERFRGLTVSAGVAGLTEHGPSAKDVIRAADDALYRAKEEGRNAVRSAD